MNAVAIDTARVVPVTALQHAEPDFRARLELPEGLTIREIIKDALPGLPPQALERTRIALITPTGEVFIPKRLWSRVRPRAGVHVLIRVVPGKGVFKSVLSILVSIAAAFIANFFAPFLLAGWSPWAVNLAKGVITMAVPAAGALMKNPFRQVENYGGRSCYSRRRKDAGRGVQVFAAALPDLFK